MRSAFIFSLLILLSCTYALSLQRDFWATSQSGNWETDSNWSTGQQPTVNTDVIINVDSKVTVTLSNDRSVDGILLSLGNQLVLGSGVDLILAPGVIGCTPGSYVNHLSQTCIPCPTNTIQPEENEAFCTACNNQISNSNHTACIFCPAGTQYSSGSCVNCQAGQSTSGTGDSCSNCQAGYSSVAGGPCTPCPSGHVSVSGGLCVGCLPQPQPITCATNLDGVFCSGFPCLPVNGTLACDCSGNVFTTYPDCESNANTIVLPVEGNSAFIYNPKSFQTEILAFTTLSIVANATVNQIGIFVENPTLDPPFNDPFLNLVTSVKFLLLTNLSLAQTNPPAGYIPTSIGFQLYTNTFEFVQVYTSNTPSIQVFIPYDFLIAEPNSLELFYFNLATYQWVKANFNCGSSPSPFIYDNGVMRFSSFQLTGQFWVFRKSVLPSAIPTPGGHRFGGEQRTETTTTQLSGLVPQPNPSGAPKAPVSQPQKFNDATSSAPSIFLLALLSFILFVF